MNIGFFYQTIRCYLSNKMSVLEIKDINANYMPLLSTRRQKLHPYNSQSEMSAFRPNEAILNILKIP